MPRSPTAFLARIAAALVLATFGGAFTVTRALAADQGDDVSKLFSFGGACVACELSGRKLPEAHFVGANFRGATLTGVNFSGAEMDRAVGLTQRQLDGACGDATTTLPRGLRIPTCG